MLAAVGALLTACSATAGVGPQEPAAGGHTRATPSSSAPASAQRHDDTQDTQPSGFVVPDPTRSTSDPTSIWVVVNKVRPLTDIRYRPSTEIVRGYQVAAPAAGALRRLLDAADSAGLSFKIASAFRSFDYQDQLYRSQVLEDGQAAADGLTARPGYSEHQTGLAIDLVSLHDGSCNFDSCFARTPEGRWLADNAYKFGFVLRYPAGKQLITGYRPEPWHLRYIGKPLAFAMHRAGISTLEEALGVPGGPYKRR